MNQGKGTYWPLEQGGMRILEFGVSYVRVPTRYGEMLSRQSRDAAIERQRQQIVSWAQRHNQAILTEFIDSALPADFQENSVLDGFEEYAADAQPYFCVVASAEDLGATAEEARQTLARIEDTRVPVVYANE